MLFREFAQGEGAECWKMNNDALFVRLDAFRERLNDALDFTKTVMQYNKCVECKFMVVWYTFYS